MDKSKKLDDLSNILLHNSTMNYSSLGDYSKVLDWSKKHVNGPRPLHQQIARVPFSGPEVHEKRFEDTALPEFSSRSTRLISFNMGEVSGRSHHEKFDFKQTCLDYVPKYDLKQERSSSYNFG